MTFKDIRHVQARIWSDVQESLRLHRASRQAARERPRDLSPSARRRAKIEWDRVVANEAVWAIAKNDLLLTPEAGRVIEAARAWLKMMGPDMVEYPIEFEEVEFKLRDALNAYATTFHISDEEVLPDSLLAATVSPITR